MDLRYPVGRFVRPDSLSDADRKAAIDDIAAAPAKLRAAVRGLDDVQLDTPYRPDGWTVRQVVHHVPESHLNAYTRFKLALTEDTPTIKPYDENAWANTAEVKTTPIETSLVLLEALHDRWVRLLETLGQTDFDRRLNHPENGMMNLHQMLALYSWHGRHHVGHITSLRERSGWTSYAARELTPTD
jgi:uncharacterized damage-inducible protein DinB